MKKLTTILVVCTALIATQSVRAELSASFAPVSLGAGVEVGRIAWVEPVAPLHSVAEYASAGVSADFEGLGSIGVVDLAMHLGNESPFASAVDSTGRDVIQMPPAPSSLSLFMSAMVTLGAWQLVRSAKDITLGHVPEWYHTGGPVQVGHATPFDLDYNSLVVVTFDEPIVLSTLCLDARRELRTRCVDQHFLILADPRGPPIVRS